MSYDKLKNYVMVNNLIANKDIVNNLSKVQLIDYLPREKTVTFFIENVDKMICDDLRLLMSKVLEVDLETVDYENECVSCEISLGSELCHWFDYSEMLVSQMNKKIKDKLFCDFIF